jgi:hypothetical protein
MKIWLDDKKSPPVGQEYIWCKSAFDVDPLLEMQKVDFISFDTNLGISCVSGYSVALWISILAYDGVITPISWEIHAASKASDKKLITAAMLDAERFWDEWKIQ